jgi:hypothetical protein
MDWFDIGVLFSRCSRGWRLTRILKNIVTCPDGRILHDGYNSRPQSAGLDGRVSRLSYLADDNGSGGVGTHLEDYSYLGLAMVVLRHHAETGVDLTYIKQAGDPAGFGDGGDPYTGLDRFGRVVDQRWLPTATPQSPTDRFQYSAEPMIHPQKTG